MATEIEKIPNLTLEQREVLQKLARCVKCGGVMQRDFSKTATLPVKVKRCECNTAVSGRPKGHGLTINRQCALCRHDDIDIIEDAYINWDLTAQQIANKTGLDYKTVILPHFRGRGLLRERAFNNVPFYEKAVHKAMQHLDADEVDPDTVMRVAASVAKQADAVEGRVIQKAQVAHKGELTIVQPPMPGGAPGSEQDANVDQEKFQDIIDTQPVEVINESD